MVLLLLILPLMLKVVREYQRIVLFRLGRMIGVRRARASCCSSRSSTGRSCVDLREFFLEIPHQTSITKDNAAISIDFITFFKVVDPEASVVQVANFAGAAQNIAATTLRSVVGDISLDDVLAERDEINQVLRTKLDEITERWGVKVTNVEIREIIPPPAVQEAMTRQMSAERTRRALVTEAEGDKSAAVLRAEGSKQANILSRRRPERRPTILSAEGDKQAAELRAEGFALALEAIYGAARDIDAKTMTHPVPRDAQGAGHGQPHEDRRSRSSSPGCSPVASPVSQQRRSPRRATPTPRAEPRADTPPATP